MEKKWNKHWSSLLILLICILIIILIFGVTYYLIYDQIEPFLKNPVSYIDAAKKSILSIQSNLGVTFFTEEMLADIQARLIRLVTALLTNTFNILANLALMFFILYYMFVNYINLDYFIKKSLPLKPENIQLLEEETNRLIKVSAIGIPIISIVQGIFATIGYILFGVNEYMLLGLLTGLMAFFPIIGTMVIWLPLTIVMYAHGMTWQAIGLGIYSLIITGNVDYLTRITFLKRMGKVHPIVTITGVIIGLSLFGFVGLIFGPLLVSYMILLYQIYINEFLELPSADSMVRD